LGRNKGTIFFLVVCRRKQYRVYRNLSASVEPILLFSETKKDTLLFWKPRSRKTQRVADIIDNIMGDSIEGENSLASFTDERSTEASQGGDDSTGKKQ
jgi:hypothetical protein